MENESLKSHCNRLIAEFESGRVSAIQVTWSRVEATRVDNEMGVTYDPVFEGWTAFCTPDAGFALLGFGEKYKLDMIASLNAAQAAAGNIQKTPKNKGNTTLS